MMPAKEGPCAGCQREADGKPEPEHDDHTCEEYWCCDTRCSYDEEPVEKPLLTASL